MSYWSHNPELYTEIIFREMIDRGLCNEGDDPEEAVEKFSHAPEFYKVAIAAESNYWADQIDAATDRMKEKDIP